MRIALLFAASMLPCLLLAADEEPQTSSLPEIKATLRFHSDAYGIVPDEINLPASTLLEAKQRRVIEGDLARLPIRVYVRETPNQPRPAIEVNIVNNRTNQALPGYPARQDVGSLGMLSFNVPLTGPELETLVHGAKKSSEGKLGKVDSVSLHIDVDIPVDPKTDADDNPIFDCEELLNQDGSVVNDVAVKLNQTSNGGMRTITDIYTGCLNKQTDSLSAQLKPETKKTIERIQQLLPDVSPVTFDSAVNANGGTYFSMLSLAGVAVDSIQAETLNRLVKQLGQSSAASPEARKAVTVAFASCQTTLKQLVPAPENPSEESNTADLKKGFQRDLAKTKAALKELQEIATRLPDNSAMLLAQSSLAILETPLGFQ